jgi:ribosomal protein S12 methylthiotransferase
MASSGWALSGQIGREMGGKQLIGTSSVNSVSCITLGCAKNEVDSDRMRSLVQAAGYAVGDTPELADAVIVNTCSFLTEATEEALAAIFDVLALEGFAAGSRKLLVAGCMPARYGDDLANELPEVAAFIPTAEEDDIVAVLERVLGQPAPGNAVGERPALLRTCTAPWAYVKISDGCDRFCSFCTIPLIRGRYHSYPAADILAEVDGLVGEAAREIVLLGQDTGIWGHDLKGTGQGEPKNLAGLLGALATRHPQTWFRVMYLQPQGVTDELLAVMASHSNICDYLDIPLQHASQRVLKEMNRAGNGAEYLELLGRIRRILPNVTLRTTVIAGFPGETRADARELERFLAAARFDYVGVFSYSQEDGTKAGARADQVPVRTRNARAQRLRDLADRIGFELNERWVDTVCDVLVIGPDEDELGDEDGSVAPDGSAASGGGHGLIGRTQSQAPDVDGVVHLDKGIAGSIVSARITGAYCYELDAETLGGR